MSFFLSISRIIHFCIPGCKTISRRLCFSIFLFFFCWSLCLCLILIHFRGGPARKFQKKSPPKFRNLIARFSRPKKSEIQTTNSETTFLRKNLQAKMQSGKFKFPKSKKYGKLEFRSGRRPTFHVFRHIRFVQFQFFLDFRTLYNC